MTSTFTTAKGSDSCEAVSFRKAAREELERLVQQVHREVAENIFRELDKPCPGHKGWRQRQCLGCYADIKAKYLGESQ